MRIAWLGLGAMGYPMAARIGAQHETSVWNRTAEVAERHADEHGTTAAALEEAVRADVVCSCLPTTAEVVEVAESARPDLPDGAVWVDCTSGEPAPSRILAEDLAAAGVTYLDAPVSGGTDGAAAGTLTVMVGGDGDALDRVRPVLETFADRVVHVGPVGAGHAVKAVNNTLLAANLWTVGEGLAALVKQGIAADVALEVINGSSGRSFVTERLVPERVVTREWPRTFALSLLSKDAGIGAGVLDDSEVAAPLLHALRDLVRAAARELDEGADHVEMLKLIERWAGTEIR